MRGRRIRAKLAIVVTFGIILVAALLLIDIYLLHEPVVDLSIKTKVFSISDSEQWIFEEFQGRRFQMVTYEENKTKKLFLIQVDMRSYWQINEGRWFKSGSPIAISSGLDSNFTSIILDSDYQAGGLESLEYEVKFDDFYFGVSFSFDTTVYINATQAWRNDMLEMSWFV